LTLPRETFLSHSSNLIGSTELRGEDVDTKIPKTLTGQ
jgi:hypothetical protein